ncbi:MAG: transposase [Anaerolineae bacterium]|nr:transposase [Anaerolineae bacterium]
MSKACLFQMVMPACELTNWFRRLVLWGELRKAEVATLRRKVLTITTKLVRRGRRLVLNLTRAFPMQGMFESILGRVRAMSLHLGRSVGAEERVGGASDAAVVHVRLRPVR